MIIPDRVSSLRLSAAEVEPGAALEVSSWQYLRESEEDGYFPFFLMEAGVTRIAGGANNPNGTYLIEGGAELCKVRYFY